MKQPNGLDRMKYFTAAWYHANPAGGKAHVYYLTNCTEQKSPSEDKELLSQS